MTNNVNDGILISSILLFLKRLCLSVIVLAAVALIIMGAAALIYSGSRNDSKEVDAVPANVKALSTEAIKLKNSMVFFKHDETGQCFAYAWGGMANGGPALASISCQVVQNSKSFIK